MTDRNTRSSTFLRQIEIPEHNEEINSNGSRDRDFGRGNTCGHIQEVEAVNDQTASRFHSSGRGRGRGRGTHVYKKLNQLYFKQDIQIEVVVMFVFAKVILLLSLTIFLIIILARSFAKLAKVKEIIEELQQLKF